MEIGLITGAFGIKGEVKVLSLNGEPERFVKLKSLIIVKEDGEEALKEISEVRVHQEFALIKFEGIESRSDADRLKSCPVLLIDGDLTEAEEASVYREKLIGMEVFTSDGTRLGVIEEVIETGANDVYDVRDDGESVLLPAIPDVVKETDFDGNRMIVDLLPGLV